MKKTTLTMLLCLLLCAVMLVAPMSVAVHATGSGTDIDPYIIGSLPYSTSVEITDENIGTSYYYQLTAPQNGRVTITITGDCAFTLVLQNDTQVIGNLGTTTLDAMEDDVISIEVATYAVGVANMTVTIEDFPLGSRQNPIQITIADMEKGIEIDMPASGQRWYSFVATETGVLDFKASKISWGFALCCNGAKEDPDRIDILGYYSPSGQLVVNAGETYLLCADVYNSEERILNFTAKYVPPFTIDTAAQQQMFDGLYQYATEDNGRLFGVEFNYDRKTVSVLDVKNNTFLGTYNFNYNLKNGALELVSELGEAAPFQLQIVEDATADLGAYLRLVYNGNYKLTALTADEIANLKPSEQAIKMLTGTYQDILDGEIYGTYVFDYASMTVMVSTPWDPTPVQYKIISYGVFNGELVMQSASGDEIVMNAIGGEILYWGTALVPLHVHDYRETVKYPTCEEGGYTTYTCTCGDTYTGNETPATGHNWQTPTCTAPSTCEYCHLTDGEALGHDLQAATCDKPISCSRCEYTEGEALGHDLQAATCDKPISCSRCEYTEGEALGHTWAEATCTAPKTCSVCGATEGEARGHEFNDATCTEAKTCKVCQATEGAANGHTWVDATCTTAKICSVCDLVEGSALGHDMQAATCTAPSTCSRCGRTEGQPIEHNWNDGVVTKEPTEEADGEKLLTCQSCGATKTQLIPAKGHEHKYTQQVIAPTCTENGYTLNTCGCGDSYQNNQVDALGHDWAAADCTTAKTCKRCGDTSGQVAGHTWVAATCTTRKTCSVCGKTEGGLVNHDWKAATCTTPKTCKDCGATEGELAAHTWTAATCTAPKTCSVCKATEGAALGHTWNAATCTEPETCKICGATEGDTLPHTYQAVQGGGMITYTCTVCGHSYQENANAIAITVPGAMTGTFNGTQEYTWTADKAGYLVIDESAATRVRAQITDILINGETAKKEVLGYSVSVGDVVSITVKTNSEVEINIPVSLVEYNGEAPMSFDAQFSGSKGFNELWTAPSAGQYTFIISNVKLDNNGLMDNVTFRIIDNGGGEEGNMYNHYDEAFGIDADGNHYITLEVEEGEILRLLVLSDDFKTSGTLTITVQQGAPSVHEHTFVETERKEPTCTKNGYVRSKCTVCGEEDLKKLPYPGHTEEVIPGKAPTCTETGLSDGSKCSVCGETVQAQTELPVVAHTEEVIPGKAPTCTESGLTDGSKCTVCGETVQAQTELPATGHIYGEWVTTKEPTATEDGVKTRTCACGAEETETIPALGEQPTEPQPTDPQPTDPVVPTEPEVVPTTQPNVGNDQDGGNSTIIIVIIAIVVVVGGVVAIVVMKKKK